MNQKKQRTAIKYHPVTIGYMCSDRMCCPYNGKCKYSKGGEYFKINKIIDTLRRCFDLHNLIILDKNHNRLSGTNMCPYKLRRHYSCNDCTHFYGFSCELNNKELAQLDSVIDPIWGSICPHFEKNSTADMYNEKGVNKWI